MLYSTTWCVSYLLPASACWCWCWCECFLNRDWPQRWNHEGANPLSDDVSADWFRVRPISQIRLWGSHELGRLLQNENRHQVCKLSRSSDAVACEIFGDSYYLCGRKLRNLSLLRLSSDLDALRKLRTSLDGDCNGRCHDTFSSFLPHQRLVHVLFDDRMKSQAEGTFPHHLVSPLILNMIASLLHLLGRTIAQTFMATTRRLPLPLVSCALYRRHIKTNTVLRIVSYLTIIIPRACTDLQ